MGEVGLGEFLLVDPVLLSGFESDIFGQSDRVRLKLP
jgi:hypothetical protein